MKNNKHLGFVIGGIFSLISILLTFTFAVPMLSVLPGFFLQDLISDLFPNLTYEESGKVTTAVLLIVFCLAIFFAFRRVNTWKDKTAKNRKIELVIIMLIVYLLVHPLGFYTYWALYLNFKSDAQIIFDSLVSFPFSSLSFVLIGPLVDYYYTTNIKTL